MTLQVGDRVKYVGDNEDYECAVGTVDWVPEGVPWVSVKLDFGGGHETFYPADLEKVSGRVVNEKWNPLRWPADMQDKTDAGAAAHIKRQQDKAEAVQQYRDEHRGVEPELPFEKSVSEKYPSFRTLSFDGPLAHHTIKTDGTVVDMWPPVPENRYGLAEPTFEEAAHAVYQGALDLLLKKHQDYGPLNISRSPGGPLNGLRVRMWDKLARINNLVDSGAEPENESLRDSFLDIANYGMIALLVLDGDWPDA